MERVRYLRHHSHLDSILICSRSIPAREKNKAILKFESHNKLFCLFGQQVVLQQNPLIKSIFLRLFASLSHAYFTTLLWLTWIYAINRQLHITQEQSFKFNDHVNGMYKIESHFPIITFIHKHKPYAINYKHIVCCQSLFFIYKLRMEMCQNYILMHWCHNCNLVNRKWCQKSVSILNLKFPLRHFSCMVKLEAFYTFLQFFSVPLWRYQ